MHNNVFRRGDEFYVSLKDGIVYLYISQTGNTAEIQWKKTKVNCIEFELNA